MCHGSSSCDEDRLGLSEQPSEDQCRASHLSYEEGHTVFLYLKFAGETLIDVVLTSFKEVNND